jgi:hypothetical protein
MMKTPAENWLFLMVLIIYIKLHHVLDYRYITMKSLAEGKYQNISHEKYTENLLFSAILIGHQK